VVLISVHLVNDNLWMLPGYVAHPQFEIPGHTAREDLSPVFGRDDKVIPGVEDSVTEPVVFHTLILQEKTTGRIHLRPTGRRSETPLDEPGA